MDDKHSTTLGGNGFINDGYPPDIDPMPGEWTADPNNPSEEQQAAIDAMRDVAHHWGDRAWFVRCGSKDGPKVPVDRNWPSKRVTLDKVQAWALGASVDKPPRMIGIIPHPLGLAVVDNDAHKSGRLAEAREAMREALGEPVVAYPSLSGGEHAWYRAQLGRPAYKWAHGEVRGESPTQPGKPNGFVAVPWSEWPILAEHLTHKGTIDDAEPVDMSRLPQPVNGKDSESAHDRARDEIWAIAATHAWMFDSDEYAAEEAAWRRKWEDTGPTTRDAWPPRELDALVRGAKTKHQKKHDEAMAGDPGIGQKADDDGGDAKAKRGADWRARFRIVPGDEIESKPGRFVDKHRLMPSGALVCFFGQGEVGKGRTLQKLVADATTGALFMDETPRPVLYLSQEDDAGGIVRPSVECNGGDPAMFSIVALADSDDASTTPGGAFENDDAITHAIAAATERFGQPPAFVVVDPLRTATSRTSGEDELRTRLLNINQVARRHDTCIVGVNHAVKAQKRAVADGAELVNLMRDSGAYRDHSRQCLHLAKADDDQRYLCIVSSKHGQAGRVWTVDEDHEPFVRSNENNHVVATFDQVHRITITEQTEMTLQDIVDKCYTMASVADGESLPPQDLYEAFCKERLVAAPKGEVSKAVFRNTYNDWAKENGHKPMPKTRRTRPSSQPCGCAGSATSKNARPRGGAVLWWRDVEVLAKVPRRYPGGPYTCLGTGPKIR